MLFFVVVEITVVLDMTNFFYTNDDKLSIYTESVKF